jgi:hypothetical protein
LPVGALTVRHWRAVIVAAAAGAALVPIPAPWVERWYSQGVYPVVQRVLTGASSVLPVAGLDLAVGLLLIAGVHVLVRRVRRSGAWQAVRGSVLSLVVLAAILYLWFLLAWGLSYRRVPIEEKVAYDPERVTQEQARRLAGRAVTEVNALRLRVEITASADAGLSAALMKVHRRLGGRRPVLFPEPARSLAGWYFRKAAIDGMTNPFFLEIILNPDLLPFERPFVLAHEWAHLAGYADESEANFVAWLTCITGPEEARYSGWLSAYEHIAAVLPREERRALEAQLAPPVRADLAAGRERLARASPRVSSAARGAYDTYLRANRVEEGIASYGAVVRLMLATTFDPDWRVEITRR